MSVGSFGFKAVDSASANFLAGDIPDWLTISGSGGSVTAETVNGGRAILSSSGSGNNARLKSQALSVDAYEGVALRAVIGHNQQARGAGNATTQVGFQEPNDYDQQVFHRLNGAKNGNPHSVKTKDASGAVYTPTREWVPEYPTETELVWDTVTGRVIHRYQDIYSVDITSNVPSTEESYEIDILCQSNTPNTSKVYVYEVEVSYLRRLKR